MTYIEQQKRKDRSPTMRFIDFPLVALLLAMGIAFSAMKIGSMIGHLLPAFRSTASGISVEPISKVALLAAYWFVISRMGRYPRNDYKDPHALRHLGLGLAAGAILMSAAVAIAAIADVYRIVGRGDFSDFIPALIGTAVSAAIVEELLFRGIMFRWIEEFGGSWMALLVTSSLFGGLHMLNPNASLVGGFGIAFEAGIMLGAAYMLTRSLWMPMGIHAAWNFTQGEIFGVPVSGYQGRGIVQARLEGNPLLTGNGFGLEASLFAIGLATIFGLYLLWLAIRRGRLVRPLWRKEGPSRQDQNIDMLP